MPHFRSRLLLAGSLSAALSTGCQAAPASTGLVSRPNILFVLADDMEYGDLTCYGGQGVKTPNIDRLAKEGIRFTQYYVNSPLCSPSRTALTTGQYPARWGITSFIDNRAANERRGMAQWLDLKAPTLARSLACAGYLTGHFGKWHMGGGRDVGEAPLPTQYGFSQSLTQFEGLGDRVLPLMSGANGGPSTKLGLGVASEKLGRGQVSWVPRDQVTSAFANRAISFIKDADKAGKPFYVNLWPDDVHSPFDPPQELRGDGRKRSLYRGVVTNMDEELGPILQTIRDNPKLRDNTLIIFASDNGPEPGAGLAGPLRGGKGELYEGGIREPFILWGPGILPIKQRGTVNTSAIVSGVDFLPSLLHLAGVKDVPQGDGTDLSATFSGKTTSGRTQPLFWKRPPDRADSAGKPLPDLAVRDGNWKLLVNEDGSHAELYDLSQDVGETKDVDAANAPIAKRLTEAVLAWNHTLPVPNCAKDKTFNTATHFELHQGDQLDRFQAPSIANKGFSITARFEPKGTTGGVIVAQGGVAQGYALFLDAQSKLNFLVRAGGAATTIVSPPISGAHTVVASLGADGSLALKLDGQMVAQGKAPQLLATQPRDGLNVGSDADGAVGPYETPFPFAGNIDSVVIELEGDRD